MTIIYRLLQLSFLAALCLPVASAAAMQADAVTPPAPFLLPLSGGDRQARLALALLGRADAHGLDPEHYGHANLARRLDTPRDADTSAALERDLGQAMLRYLTDLHNGRAPSAYRVAGGPGGYDAQARLEQALREDRLEQAVNDAAPGIPLYRRVMASLAQYRELARQKPSWPPLPALGRGDSTDRVYPGIAALRERLQLLGDLEGGTFADNVEARNTTELAAALRRFQSRHGLAEDGVLGPNTLAALQIPPAHRAAQLALTLERLRWLPPLPRGRAIAVNLPAYRLWAFDSGDAVAPARLEMRVIVGTAARTPTPLFIGQMRYLEINPYWNVPRSIAAGEIATKLARNGAYLRQNGMELVSADGRVLADGAAGLAALRDGAARIRQRPGGHNVLGALKFAMPNPMNIYLHSTSATGLFDRARRDLSHGCIRVEQPVALAEFVLASPQVWNAGAIETAIASGKTRTVHLPATVPVVLFYATAITEHDGRTLFADDIYGGDAALIEVLGY